MRFEFTTAARIIFGAGVSGDIGEIAGKLGNRALVITGKNGARISGLRQTLSEHGINMDVFKVPCEPTLELLGEAIQIAQGIDCNLVIGLGGGSIVDTGKAVAAFLTNQGNPVDYLEVIGKGRHFTKPPVPYIAMPTTAGTGAEVTRNAVFMSREHRMKVSMRSPMLTPKIALVDPELTIGLPREITACAGLDAFTQLLEPYVSVKSNPLTDALCIDGMQKVASSLKTAFEQPGNLKARTDMSFSSLLSGMCLANACLGAVHGFAGVIGGMFLCHHGAICGSLLPHVMEVNVRALRQRAPGNPVLQRYDRIAQLLTGESHTQARDGIEWVRRLCSDLKIPNLKNFGIDKRDFPLIIEKALVTSSIKGNPIALSPEELSEILEMAY